MALLSTMTQERYDQLMAWWLCPNTPKCEHGSVLHDLNELDDVAVCCVDGCHCGQEVDK